MEPGPSRHPMGYSRADVHALSQAPRAIAELLGKGYTLI
jgi:hypothetical protein